MIILLRVLGAVAGLLGAFSAFVAWIGTPYSYPWAEDRELAHQTDPDGLAAILAFALAGLMLELLAARLWLAPRTTNRRGLYDALAGLALLIAASCLVRFLWMLSIPDTSPV
jgi:NhaP-type Na+/H+ or K+/H+ antiporter